MNFNWIKTALLAATAMVSLNSFSQDLIARQAPIDRKLKSVDSLALQKQIRAEQSLYPGLDLYPNWNNEFVQAYGNAIVPESWRKPKILINNEKIFIYNNDCYNVIIR